jgi:hypothetical protein
VEVTTERLAEIKALGRIASGAAVPELIAEIERLRALMAEAEPELDAHLGASTPGQMNWDKVRRENLLIKIEQYGRKLSPEERRRGFADWQKGDKK